MTTRLFDGARLRAELTDRGHDRLIVTFDFRRSGKDGFDPPRPSGSFDRNGWAQLAIGCSRNDWFINDETPALEAALAPLADRYGRIHMLGYSMGGYGAFRFAAMLGAQAVVATSPQVSIDPAIVPFDRRFRTEAAGFDPSLGVLPDHPALTGVIVIDPFRRLDLRNALMLQARFPRVRIVRLAFGGHPAGGAMRDAGKGGVMNVQAQRAAPDGRAILRQHRAARRLSPAYWTALAGKARARRPALAAHALDRAETLSAAKSPRAG